MESLKLSRFHIQNFRNIDGSVFSFSKGINCIFGKNGNGKTNLLEAIYLVINKKSFRKNVSFPHYLSLDGEKPEILFSTEFVSGEDQVLLSGKILGQGKKNWQTSLKGTKELGSHAVFVNPFDSYSFFNSSSERRKWIDHHLSALSKEYKKILTRHDRLVRQRNKLLSFKMRDQLMMLDILDKELAQLIVDGTTQRKTFLRELEQYSPKYFEEIFQKDHSLKIEVQGHGVLGSSDEVYDAILSNRQKDLDSRSSSIGLHRQKIELFLDDFDVVQYASLGQQKMAYLSLLFAYIELFRYKFRSYPIVLIDDVSGELDQLRWGRLVNFLKESKFQVFITTANDGFRAELEKIPEAKKYFVSNGAFETYQ